MTIQKLQPNIHGKDLSTSGDLRSYAQKRNMNYTSTNLNDGSTAKILSNEKEVDCFIMKNGKIIGGKGFRGNLNYLFEMSGKLIDDLLKHSADKAKNIVIELVDPKEIKNLKK
jgi:hypothetical protein